MVGSMETMASSVVSREMVVFLEDMQVRGGRGVPRGAPPDGPRAREEPGARDHGAGASSTHRLRSRIERKGRVAPSHLKWESEKV